MTHLQFNLEITTMQQETILGRFFIQQNKDALENKFELLLDMESIDNLHESFQNADHMGNFKSKKECVEEIKYQLEQNELQLKENQQED